MISQHLDIIALVGVCGGAVTLVALVFYYARAPKEDPRMARLRQRQIAPPPPRITGHAHPHSAPPRDSRFGDITVLPAHN